MLHRFLVIDDSELDGYIAQKKIENANENVEINFFKDANRALSYIKSENTGSTNSLTIILLDILMPLMNGYDFMDEFERMPEVIKNNYMVIAITSSMYKNQINKIYAYKSIKGVLEKPFTINDLNKIIHISNPEYIL